MAYSRSNVLYDVHCKTRISQVINGAPSCMTTEQQARPIDQRPAIYTCTAVLAVCHTYTRTDTRRRCYLLSRVYILTPRAHTSVHACATTISYLKRWSDNTRAAKTWNRHTGSVQWQFSRGAADNGQFNHCKLHCTRMQLIVHSFASRIYTTTDV